MPVLSALRAIKTFLRFRTNALDFGEILPILKQEVDDFKLYSVHQPTHNIGDGDENPRIPGISFGDPVRSLQ
uniref:Uncharacterized protein n=1 Tax=Romanomermis culicivorax TaxID=13658 RepID=A0A915L0U5_ROMCU